MRVKLLFEVILFQVKSIMRITIYLQREVESRTFAVWNFIFNHNSNNLDDKATLLSFLVSRILQLSLMQDFRPQVASPRAHRNRFLAYLAQSRETNPRGAQCANHALCTRENYRLAVRAWKWERERKEEGETTCVAAVVRRWDRVNDVSRAHRAGDSRSAQKLQIKGFLNNYAVGGRSSLE